MFARHYIPIAIRQPGKPAKFCKQWFWCKHVAVHYFHDQYPSVWSYCKAAVPKVLKEWGLPPLPPEPPMCHATSLEWVGWSIAHQIEHSQRQQQGTADQCSFCKQKEDCK
jgi:hypothetical protein